ncbi:unnamed protein product, partial [Durusdinium trenchii]
VEEDGLEQATRAAAEEDWPWSDQEAQLQNERNLAKKLMIRGMDLHGGMHPGLHPRVHGVAGPRLH